MSDGKLYVGDVVEASRPTWPAGSYVHGPVYECNGYLAVSDVVVAYLSGVVFGDRTVRVINPVRRPVYVNHARRDFEPGDIVRDADSALMCTWTFDDPTNDHAWRHTVMRPSNSCGVHKSLWSGRDQLPLRLRLLVDGPTGLAVPS